MFPVSPLFLIVILNKIWYVFSYFIYFLYIFHIFLIQQIHYLFALPVHRRYIALPLRQKMHSHLSLDASALSVLKISYWLLFLFLFGPYISADQHDQCDHCDDKWS